VYLPKEQPEDCKFHCYAASNLPLAVLISFTFLEI
jgi:hypothetical protein